MLDLLWLIPVLPYLGFVVLALVGPRMSREAVAAVGVGSVGLSAVVALLVAVSFVGMPDHPYTQTMWQWIAVGSFTPAISLYLDSLSLIMTLVVTVVGFLIHLYSAEYMDGEEGYSRFFAYMNLFVGSMLMLVLADNLLLLLLGWEGVGLCSYLLIGFWYRDPANGRAARKAFVVTRVGDTAFMVGIFLLFTNLGSMSIQQLMQNAQASWPVGSSLAVAASLLLLGGAVGKSAQLPLQTWLPDAMAGPTPVSALIHAATMVTAGVYLIARTHVLFALAPSVMLLVAIVGAITLLYAGFSALAQSDIKRVLAYSTISQIGYMFLGLGVGAWSSAIFHFWTHAFFKALLFLAAGVVILAMHHEQNIFRMGGLRREMPFTYRTFLIGAASLSAVPLVTAGFYSKDAILVEAWSSPLGSPWLWAAGLVGAFLTSLYTFRMVFITFFGETKHRPVRAPQLTMRIPLAVLAFLAVFGGFVELPATLGGFNGFSGFLHSALPSEAAAVSIGTEALLQLIAAAASLGGIYVAYLFYLRGAGAVEEGWSPWGEGLNRFWLGGWGFDWVYDRVFVRTVSWFSNTNRNDFVDLIYQAIGWVNRGLNELLSATETGQLRWYAAGIAGGAALTIAIAVFL